MRWDVLTRIGGEAARRRQHPQAPNVQIERDGQALFRLKGNDAGETGETIFNLDPIVARRGDEIGNRGIAFKNEFTARVRAGRQTEYSPGNRPSNEAAMIFKAGSKFESLGAGLGDEGSLIVGGFR